MVFSHPSGERRLLVELEAEAPHRLTGLELEGGAAPAAPPPQPEPEGYAEVDALARNLVGFLARGELQTAVRRTTAPRLRERYGDAELTRVLGEVRSALGGENEEFSFRAVEADGEDLWVHVDVAGRDEMRFRVFVTEDAPYLIRGIDTRPTPVVNADDVTPDEWPDRIRDFVDERVRRGEFSGAVAVGRRGEPLLAEAWGIADAETGRPVTVHTPLNLGSMNKMFTGLALAQVEAEGGVDFDDTVGEYLPDYPNASIREEATLHQLLTHTAGIPGYWNSAYVAARDTITTLAGFIDTFATEPLLFEPGTEWGYSNGGPVVAGRILEVATGESYYDYVRSHIYGPAGMTDSDHYPRPDPDGRIAIGYEAIVEGEPRGPNTANMGGIGSPAGGGYSTVLDLVRFAGALDRGTLLDPEALETVWSPPRQGPESGRYGYLWSSGTTAGHRWVGHNGGGPGVSADFRYFPETGHVIVVLSNVSGGAMPVSNWITELVAAHLDPFDQSLPGGARAARPGAAH
ncbi:MAG: serine hydrolase domain-containing protein [Longimicrobiales bacterium]